MRRSSAGPAISDPQPMVAARDFASSTRSKLSGGPAGVVLLALALFLVLVVPAILNPGLRGKASMVPTPAPPPIGTCVLLPPRGASAAIQVVDCAEPHDGEVTKTWRAGDRVTAKDWVEPSKRYFLRAGGSARFTFFQCFGWNSDYVGIETVALDGLLGTDEWLLAPPLYDGRLIYSSPRQRASDFGWSACVVTPATGSSYSGTIRNAGRSTSMDRPDEYLTCLARSDYGAVEMAYRTCADPHLLEPIALDADVENDLTPEVAQRDCERIVRTVTGSDDPTFGGRVRVSVESLRLRTLSQPSYARAFEQQSQDCVLIVADRGLLTGSVVGLAGRPLPYSD
jgi:hypothetical protein